MKRTNSYGGAAEMTWVPPYGTGDVFDENNLARRPRDWRLDYSPRGAGLSTVMSLVSGRKSDVPGECIAEYTTTVIDIGQITSIRPKDMFTLCSFTRQILHPLNSTYEKKPSILN